MLYVTGGVQRPRHTDEWRQYGRARILRVDPAGRDGAAVFDYVTPAGACPEEEPSIVFKHGAIANNRLYACTCTEVLILELPSFSQAGYLSLPCFNDLHHVTLSRQGTLLVADTGLDMVLETTPDGQVLREWDALGREPWNRFSRDVDYRRAPTTKPHECHPNFVFERGDEIWVTRHLQKDAVCLTHNREALEFHAPPHDGLPVNGRLYFTTIDGWLYIFDAESLARIDRFDLKSSDDTQGFGWCRGVLPIDDRHCWVGFSRTRPSRFREGLSWVRHGFSHRYLPTRIVLYDTVKKTTLDEISLEPMQLSAVFSIFPF